MMTDKPKYHEVKLVGRHVPDFQMNEDENGNKVQTPLPGEFEVGVMFGKKFHVLHRFQAGNVLNADGSHVEPNDKPSGKGA